MAKIDLHVKIGNFRQTWNHFDFFSLWLKITPEKCSGCGESGFAQKIQFGVHSTYCSFGVKPLFGYVLEITWGYDVPGG